MKSQMKTSNHISIVLVFIVTILVFVFDILIPRGINMGDFYPLSIFLTTWNSYYYACSFKKLNEPLKLYTKHERATN